MDQTPWSWVDWGWLGRQLPWVLGLAIVLAALSWGDWSARVRGIRRRELFSSPPYDAVISFGLGLVTIGLALNATRSWEPYLWWAFTLVWFFQASRAIWVWRHPG